jgi:cyanophycinase
MVLIIREKITRNLIKEAYMGEKAQGNLVIIGGAEDKDADCIILRRFVDLAGGKEAIIGVITTATEYPGEVGNQYQKLFYDLGALRIENLIINKRDDADDQHIVERLASCTGVFFTGGDQLRITSIIGGSEVDKALRVAYKDGVVIAGTSAGASVMSDTMIVEGDDTDTAKKCTLNMAHGMGLLEEVVIDQHFAQRGRINRLLTAVAENPYVLGVGIDEDTAIIVNSDATFEVIGSQTVTVVDGQNIKFTNVSESKPNEPLVLSNVILHILPAGYCFDLGRREPFVKVKEIKHDVKNEKS